VDAVSGGAGNDTISGILGNTASFSVGDNINGGAGTDTLNLIAAQHTANGLVSIAGVENVNVRLIGTAAETVELNAADWSGVAVLSNASSLSATTLEVSGVADTTNVTLYGNTDVSIQYASTTTANAVGTLVGAGTFAGATNIWVSATAAATAHLDFDLENAGLVSGIAVTLSGNNFARLEGGANAEVYTITGVGSAALVTDDTITSFDASGASANIDVTFEGTSEVVAKGGAGNDTFRFGTTISNSDSVDGGAGTNTVYVTEGAFNRNLNTTNVQTAVVTFTDSGTLNASASTVSTFNVSAGSAGVAASISQIQTGAVINLTNDALGDVTLDYASGAASTTINVGTAATASADVGIGTLAITDVANVTINGVSGISAGATASITTATFDSDVKSLVIQTLGGSGSLEFGAGGEGSIGGITAMTLNANGAANINYADNLSSGGALSTLVVNTFGAGTAGSATMGNISATALTSITLNASGAADITLGTVALGNGASAAGTVNASITVNQGVEQDTTIGDIVASGGIALTFAFTSKSSGSIVLNDLDLKAGSSTALTQTVDFGGIAVATGASFELDGVDLEATTAAARVTLGAVTVANGSGGSFDFGSASGISAGAVLGIVVSPINITVGNSASAAVGVINNTGGSVGAISVSVADGASAQFGSAKFITASAMSTISVIVASAAGVDFGAMTSEKTIGDILIGGSDGGDATFSTLGASASIGNITVSGALDVTIGAITAPTIGTVDNTQQGVSGTFSIDLSGVTNAVEVKLGAATNTVISGVGNDVITLLAGRTAVAGNDNIQYGTASQGNDNIINFIGGAAASGGDQIEFSIASFGTGIIDADGSAIAAASNVLFGTASGAAVTLGASANIILFTTAYASTAALITDAKADITLSTATLTSGDFFAVWTDGTDAYISQIHIEEGASATDGIATLASASGVTVTTFATLSGVSAGALVAANFDFV
jgi:S-layer protein